MQTLLTTPGLTIAHDSDNGWLHLVWRGMHNQQESKACCLKILEQVRQHQVHCILNDATQDQDGWGELTHWLAQDYFGTLAATGIVAVAWVLPQNLRARMDVQRVLAQTECPLVDTFTDPEAAYHWLQRSPMPQPPEC